MTSPLPYESHSLTPDSHRPAIAERIFLAIFATGLLVLVAGATGGAEHLRFIALTGGWGAVIAGAFGYAAAKHLGDRAGIRNHGKTTASLTARGAFGWIMAVVFTGFYVVLYWFPDLLSGWMRLHDPLSLTMRGKPADQWFVYGTFYTAGILAMGAKAILKYRHSRYQIIRTASIMPS